MFVDNTQPIAAIYAHIKQGRVETCTHDYLKSVKRIIAENTASAEQQMQLLEVQKDLENLINSSDPINPGPSTFFY